MCQRSLLLSAHTKQTLPRRREKLQIHMSFYHVEEFLLHLLERASTKEEIESLKGERKIEVFFSLCKHRCRVCWPKDENLKILYLKDLWFMMLEQERSGRGTQWTLSTAKYCCTLKKIYETFHYSAVQRGWMAWLRLFVDDLITVRYPLSTLETCEMSKEKHKKSLFLSLGPVFIINSKDIFHKCTFRLVKMYTQ